MKPSYEDYIETVSLTAEMVINAFSMARQEFYEMICRTANSAAPVIRVIPGSGLKKIHPGETGRGRVITALDARQVMVMRPPGFCLKANARAPFLPASDAHL